ncbi:hypothetical protein B296_00045493 [Ensete ventricosum]|uniref:Uncharacterized protein n=1 Tax=Ensete ventricosum TaxID=4639 RepID=A0A426X8S4_ENSVE|nr:hypothetical protein B296_00045493 [Ensete ventricosum]
MVDFGRALAMKLNSNSFANRSNEDIEAGLRREYQILAARIDVLCRIAAAIIRLKGRESKIGRERFALYLGSERGTASRQLGRLRELRRLGAVVAPPQAGSPGSGPQATSFAEIPSRELIVELSICLDLASEAEKSLDRDDERSRVGRGTAGSDPCALARPRSSQHRGGARSDGKSPRVRLGRSATGVVELKSGGNVSARVDCGFLQEGQVGSRNDPSDGQVSFVIDFVISRSVEARGPYSNSNGVSVPESLSFLLLTIPLHLIICRPWSLRRDARLQLEDVDLAHLTYVRPLTPPCLCQVGFPVSGQPCWRANYPRTQGHDSHVNIYHIINKMKY